MKVSASRESLLTPLQSVIGVVERRQTMPVLANVLLVARGDKLTVTGTDLEVELMAATSVTVQQAGDVTVPGRKLLEIMRTLPEKATVSLVREAERVVVKAGRSRFTLSSLPASEFPVIEEINAKQIIRVGREHFRRLIEKTHFAMAQQDVRYYLNGTMLETSGKTLRAVATDGHRLSLAETELADAGTGAQQVIVPRKGILELQRILAPVALSEGYVQEQINEKLAVAIQTAMQKAGIGLLLNPQATLAAQKSFSLEQPILAELNTALPSAQLVPPAGWEPREAREQKAAQAAQAGQQGTRSAADGR